MFNTSDDNHTYGGIPEVRPPAALKGFDLYFYMPSLQGARSSWTETPAFIPTTLTYSLTFLVGVAGNILVILALLSDRKARNVTSSFLVSLAVADLLFLIVCVPVNTSEKLVDYWTGGSVMCKAARFAEMLSAEASVLNLTAVSIERYVVIVHSMKARSYCTMGRALKYIVCVWTASIIISSPTLVIMDTFSVVYYNNESYVLSMTCADNNIRSNEDTKMFASYQLFVMFVIPVVVMLVSYSVVIHVLWLSNRKLEKMTQIGRIKKSMSEVEAHSSNTIESGDADRLTVPGSVSSHRQSSPSPGRSHPTRSHPTKEYNTRHHPVGDHPARDQSMAIREGRKQVIKMLLSIIGVFFFCWGPKLILNVLKKHHLSILFTNRAFLVKTLIDLLPFVQSCMNPLIYSFMSKNFRRSMLSLFSSRCHFAPARCCQRKTEVTLTFDLDTRGAPNGVEVCGSPTRYHGARRVSNILFL